MKKIWDFFSKLFERTESKDSSISFETVRIGEQLWMAKNLDVSTYRNGDAIPEVRDEIKWANLKTGAWCYFDNECAENGSTYGKLYNWYAVNDPRGLAPEGYHIPSDEEWTTLTDYLGGENVAGTKMKSTSGWFGNGNGTNVSGFAGLPGGCRYYNGSFHYREITGDWWSSSVAKTRLTCLAWERLLDQDGDVGRHDGSWSNGLSVRCLGD